MRSTFNQFNAKTTSLLSDLFGNHSGIVAFTLIELSMVLAIIGFIIGGVLVGNDLISNANVRKQIKQIQDLEVQINTFRDKYQCLPGDCGRATDYLGTSFRGNVIVNGDDDGVIMNVTGTYTTGQCMSSDLGNGEGPAEVSQLFLHLNAAKIGNYMSNGSGTIPSTVLNNSNSGLIISCLDGDSTSPTQFAKGNIMVMGLASDNSNGGRIRYHTFGNGWLSSSSKGIPVIDIAKIDLKIDDGYPSSGKFGIVHGCVRGTTSYTPVSPVCSPFGSTIVSDVVVAGKRTDN